MISESGAVSSVGSPVPTSVGARDARTALPGELEGARRDPLHAVVLELHVVAEMHRGGVASDPQVRQQRAAERGEAFEVGVGVGDDLAQEGVEVHERAEAVAERRLLLLVEGPEPVDRGLQQRLEARVVVRAALPRRPVEDLGERLDLGVVVDLHRVELVPELLEPVGVRGLQQLGAVVVRRERRQNAVSAR